MPAQSGRHKPILNQHTGISIDQRVRGLSILTLEPPKIAFWVEMELQPT
eukprot:CCRYP_001644-RA/>CCRYP_001644-RA protein AED:0.00 eAED:0.00 QI:20/1/1/1/0/0/2/42/48